jgi:YVTN family beta-propeller protein
LRRFVTARRTGRDQGRGARILWLMMVAAVVAGFALHEVGLRALPAAQAQKNASRGIAATLPGQTPHAIAGSVAAAGTAFNVYATTLQGLVPAVRGIPERVYVPNSDNGTVTVIDPVTFRVLYTIPAGSIPHHVAPAWDLSKLYVDEERSGALMVIDPRSGRPVSTVNVPDPYNLYFSPDGTTAVVVEEAFRRLEFRDRTTFALRGTLALGPGIDHLDFSADGNYFLITAEWSGEIFRVDVHTMKVTGAMNVGGLPIDVRLSPDGSVFFVANQGRNGVSVVDGSAMRELSFIPTGRGAHGLYISRDTRSLYVTNRLAGSVSVIDIASRKRTATWQTGGSPDMLQLNPDGTQLWMSSRYDGYVIVVDTSSGKVLARIRTGAGAHGLTYFPAPGLHSIGHNGVYR